MKGLAMSQPWAELLVSGKKKVEIRNKNTNHRGWFYIYACRKDTNENTVKSFGFDELPMGFIIGKAFLKGVKRYDSLREFAADVKLHLATEKELKAEGWTTKMPKYGYIISEVKRMKALPFRGMPGFFNVDL